MVIRRAVCQALMGVIALALGASGLGAQDQTEASPASRGLSFNPQEDFDAGARIFMTLDLPQPISDLSSFIPPQLPRGLTVVGEPLISDIESDNGAPVGSTITIVYRSSEPGYYPLEGGSVLLSDALVPIEPFALAIRNRNGNVPPSARWELAYEEAIVGQEIPVVLWVDRADLITFADRSQGPRVSNALVEEIDFPVEILSYEYSNVQLYSIPVATYVLTPTQSGRLTLGSSDLSFDGWSLNAPSLPFEVLDGPSQISETGAVGQFSFNASLSSREIVLGGELILTIEISGWGNLRFLTPPSLANEGFTLVQEGVDENVVATARGSEGTLSYQYFLQASRTGPNVITVPEIFWFDPIAQQVRSRGQQTFLVQVLNPELGESEHMNQFSPLSWGQAQSWDFWGSTPSLILLLGLVPGIIAMSWSLSRGRRSAGVGALFGLGLFIFMGSAGSESQQNYERFVQAYNEERYEDAVVLLEEGQDRWSPSFAYHMGITAWQMEQYDVSVAMVRSAALALPLEPHIATTLATIEDELDLERQIPVVAIFPAVAWALGILAVANGFLFLLAFMPRRFSAGRTLISLLLLTLLVGSIIGLAVAMDSRNGDRAVVYSGGAGLLRIPSSQGQVWLDLTEGTELWLKQERDEFFLVSTSYGIDGWVHKEELIPYEQIRNGEYPRLVPVR